MSFFREHRLAWLLNTPKNEMEPLGPEDVPDTLSTPADQLEQLKEELSAQPGEQPAPAQEAIADDIHQLAEQVNQHVEATAVLDKITEADTNPALEAPAPINAPAANPPTETTLIERLEKEWKEHPGRTILTGGAIVLGGALLISAIATWLQNAKEQGKAAAEHAEGGAWKKWLVGLGIGGAALFGVKIYMDEKINDLKTEAAEQARAAAEAAKNAAMEATTAAKDALGIPDALGTAPDGKSLEEVATETAKEASERLSAKGLLLMHAETAEQAGIETEAERKAVGDLLTLDTVQMIPVSQLRTDIALQEQAQNIPNMTTEKQKALRFLSLIVRADTIQHPEHFSDPTQTLAQYLDRSQRFLPTFANFGEALAGTSLADLASPEGIAQVFEQAFQSDTNTDQLLGDATIQEHIGDLGVDGKETAFTLYCAAPYRAIALLSDTISAPLAPNEPPEFREALRNIQTEVTSIESKQFLYQLLHDKQELAPLIDSYLSGNIRVLDALQLYSYLQLCKTGNALPATMQDANPSGVFLLQLKLIHLLAQKDPSAAEQVKANLFHHLLYETDASLTLPPETRESLKALGSMSGSFVLETVKDKIQNTYETMMIWWENNPSEGNTAAGVGGLLVARAGLDVWDFLNKDMHEKLYARLMDTKTHEKLLGSARWTDEGIEAWQRSTANMMGTRLNAVAEMAKQPGTDARLYNTYRSWVRRGFSPESYATFKAEAAALKPGLSGQNLRILTEMEKEIDDIQKVYGKMLQYRRFPWLAQRFWKGLKPVQKILGPIAVAITAKDVWEYAYNGGREQMQQAIEEETDADTKAFLQREKDAMERSLAIDGIGIAALYAFPPVGAAITTTKMIVDVSGVREGVEESTAYTLQTREQIERTTPSNALEQIARSAPGTLISWKQDFAMTSGMGALSDGDVFMQETFDDANTSARLEAYAAYFRMNANLLAINENMLTDAERADPVRKEQRLKTLNEEMLGYYTQSALTYIRQHTQNTFVRVDAPLLKRAELYGALSIENWLQIKMQKDNGFGKLTWQEKEEKVNALSAQRDELFASEIIDAFEQGADRATVLPPYLLENIRHDLAIFEAKISQTDFSDWSRLLNATWTSDEEMRILARSAMAEKIAQAIRSLCLAPPLQSTADFRLAIESLRNVLQTNPDTLAREALENNTDHHMKQGMNPLLLSPEGMMSLITG
jgi:hypothetical protein